MSACEVWLPVPLRTRPKDGLPYLTVRERERERLNECIVFGLVVNVCF